MARVKRKVLRTTIVLLILVAPWGLWRLALLWNVHAQLAAIRKSGLPTNAREVDKWYEAVPDTENAGLLIHKACALCDLKAFHLALEKLKLPAVGEAYSSDAIERVEALLKVHQKDLAMVEEALTHPRSRYPIDLTLAMATPLPDLAYLKNYALLYQATAVLALQRGEFPTASSNIVKCILLARTLDNEPHLISQMVRLKLLETALEPLARRIKAAPLSATEIELLAGAIKAVPDASGQLTHALVGERAFLATYFTLSKEDAARMFKPSLDDLIAANTFPNNPSIALKIAGFYDLDRGFFLHSMGIAIEKSELGPPESLRAAGYLRRAGEVASDRHYFVSGNTLAAYASTFARFGDAEANQRLPLLALRIEQFRNSNGRLPRALDELPPEPAAQILSLPFEDPYTGEPLRFKPLEHGYKIYSVGRDRQDNGGVSAPDGKPHLEGYDLVLTVAR